MEILVGISMFIFGTIVGSFLNVVILRYNTGRGLGGRSGCFSCGRNITWKELIPVLSFLVLGGRCLSCKAKISIQYPLVELLTGLVFLLIFLKNFSLLLTAFYFVVFSILIVILVYDFRHKIIPDSFVWFFVSLSFIHIFLSPNFYGNDLLFVALAGPICALPFALLWLVSRGRWIGLGDSKLILGFGWFLGLPYATSAVLIGFWAGAIFAGLMRLSSLSLASFFMGKIGLSSSAKRLTMKSELPLAPFLILGFALVFFFELNLINFFLLT